MPVRESPFLSAASLRPSCVADRIQCSRSGSVEQPWLLALALLATGCGPLLSARPACERNPALVAAVDWSTVDLVEIHITREGFEPHQVELRRNQPAILRVANADDRPRVFNAPKFFPAAALGNITVDDLPIPELCPDAIDIPPKSILDIGVVPLQSGRFPFGGPDIPVKSWGSGLAVMYVEGILIVK